MIHTKKHYKQTIEKQKQRENLESSKREVNHHKEGILNKIISY